jgi:FkbM family methyltransferase
MAPEFLVSLILVPAIPRVRSVPTVIIGTPYGGKHIVPLDNLQNSTIISGGCGEDISFDVEFAARFNSTVIMVEPIPRAINHVENVLKRIGTKSEIAFSDSGRQPVEAYELFNLKKSQLKLIPKALWNQESIIELFQPMESEHISHSVLDIQKTGGLKGSVKVKSVTVPQIMSDEGIKTLEILKLDIEGAQLEVIEDCFSHGIFPQQIIVEIDELYFPTFVGRKRAKKLLKMLRKNSYILVGKLNKYDFTFLRVITE